MKYIKPKKLEPGDTVAVLSPSWGGPYVFPAVYENGLAILKEWGLVIKEYPMTRAESVLDIENVKLRAKDVNDAFANTEVKAIFSSIGGDDSVRILPYLDRNVIQDNPKIFMGYSDSSTILTYLNQLGIVSFHGPAIMAGFSQMKALPEAFGEHVHKMLFNPQEDYEFPCYKTYCDEYLDWSEESNLGKTAQMSTDEGMRVIQGSGKVSGKLFGGCIEVLEFLKGTEYYPQEDFWNGKILCLETSEEKPSISHIKYILRNYGVQGIFDKVNAIIFGRARDYSNEEKKS